MSQGKSSDYSLVHQRVKNLKFYCEAKLFLKFSWQPASLVIHQFDVCFKNLAQTDKLWARNPNKQRNREPSLASQVYSITVTQLYKVLSMSSRLYYCDGSILTKTLSFQILLIPLMQCVITYTRTKLHNSCKNHFQQPLLRTEHCCT